MLRRFSVDFAIFSIVVDFVLVMVALRIAALLRPYLGYWFTFARPVSGPLHIDLLLYFVLPVFWVLVFLLHGIYDGRRNFRFRDELSSVLNASVLAAIALAGFLYLSFRDYSRVLYLTFAITATILLVSIRVIYRIIFRLQAKGITEKRRVLILGAGSIGKSIAQQLQAYEENGLTLVGFLDDDPLKQTDPQVLGPIDRAVEIIKQEHITVVILALPSRVWSRISALVAQLHALPLRVWVVPDYYTLALYRARVEELKGIPLIDLRAPALDDYQRLIKRIFDLVVTVLILPFALPVMGLIALAIKLDSPGPVIFRQKRVGENGRLFDMLKFRTMIDGADQMRHVIEWVDEKGRIHQDKRRPDPRVTRVGRFLRRTSLDELPQLFNVLRGEMSLIGPRPELPHLVDQYETWQRIRFTVPQGITGWWQVNGRSDKPMHEHTEDDLYYIQNYSIWLDLLILVKTVIAVIRRKGAY